MILSGDHAGVAERAPGVELLKFGREMEVERSKKWEVADSVLIPEVLSMRLAWKLDKTTGISLSVFTAIYVWQPAALG